MERAARDDFPLGNLKLLAFSLSEMGSHCKTLTR